MKVIGLTGGIGSGKSTVAGFLIEMGASVIDADEVGHEILLPGTQAWNDIVKAFGRKVLAPDGTIDRKKLGHLVFGKPEALSVLEKITHPHITQTVKKSLAELQQQGVKVAIVEATLLIEGGWQPLVEEVWVTIAPRHTILKRLKERSGYSKAESLTRIQSQRTDEERIKDADIIINTDGTLEKLRANVRKLWVKRIGTI